MRKEFSIVDDPDVGHARTCSLGAFWTAFAKNDPRTAELRKRTFANGAWPHEGVEGMESLSAVKMAEAGFIYWPMTDGPDTVLCPTCDVSLDGWEGTDDPIKEHEKRGPKCGFLASLASGGVPPAVVPTKKTVARKGAAVRKVPAAGPAGAPEAGTASTLSKRSRPGTASSSSVQGAPSAPSRAKRPKLAPAEEAENVPPVPTSHRAVKGAEAPKDMEEAPSIKPGGAAVEDLEDQSSVSTESKSAGTAGSDVPDSNAGDSAPSRPRRQRAKDVCYAEDVLDLDGKPRQTKKARAAAVKVAAQVPTATVAPAAEESHPADVQEAALEAQAEMTGEVNPGEVNPVDVAIEAPTDVAKTRKEPVSKKPSTAKARKKAPPPSSPIPVDTTTDPAPRDDTILADKPTSEKRPDNPSARSRKKASQPLPSQDLADTSIPQDIPFIEQSVEPTREPTDIPEPETHPSTSTSTSSTASPTHEPRIEPNPTRPASKSRAKRQPATTKPGHTSASASLTTTKEGPSKKTRPTTKSPTVAVVIPCRSAKVSVSPVQPVPEVQEEETKRKAKATETPIARALPNKSPRSERRKTLIAPSDQSDADDTHDETQDVDVEVDDPLATVRKPSSSTTTATTTMISPTRPQPPTSPSQAMDFARVTVSLFVDPRTDRRISDDASRVGLNPFLERDAEVIRKEFVARRDEAWRELEGEFERLATWIEGVPEL
ncbi:hypothetical protein HKX48_005420, partial [Thoreauomyces humboldtii]